MAKASRGRQKPDAGSEWLTRSSQASRATWVTSYHGPKGDAAAAGVTRDGKSVTRRTKSGDAGSECLTRSSQASRATWVTSYRGQMGHTAVEQRRRGMGSVTWGRLIVTRSSRLIGAERPI